MPEQKKDTEEITEPTKEELKTKAKYWVAVGYPENMVETWEDDIGDKVQGLPYAYCIHDRGFDTDGDSRKKHVHVLLVFPNTTTRKHALETFKALNADGKNAFPNAFPVGNIRGMYNYLIHDTETAKKAGKEQYDPSERKTGNNFDIGLFEQLSEAERREMELELAKIILDNGYCNFADFCMDVIMNMDRQYFEVMSAKSAFFEKLTRGNYQNAFDRDYRNKMN